MTERYRRVTRIPHRAVAQRDPGTFLRLSASLLCALSFLSVLLVFATSAQAQDTPILQNGGFEIAQSGNTTLPDGWRADAADFGYELTGRDVHDGERALEIGFDADASTAGYAGTIQAITLPADAVGRTLFVSGWLRRNNVESTAGLWLAFFDASGKRTTYVNDYETAWPSPSSWTSRMIEVQVPSGAARMLVGASISGESGKLLVDSVSIGLRTP